MRKKIGLLVVISIIILTSISCSITKSYNLDKLDILESKMKNSKDILLEDISIGYTSDGEITAWIYPKYPTESEMKSMNIPNYESYDIYVSKRLMDLYPEINSIWIFGHFINITRGVYEDKGLKDFPLDVTGFFKQRKKLETLVDLEASAEQKENYSFDPILTSFKKLYGERFKDYKYISSAYLVTYFQSTINGILNVEDKSKELKRELAKAIVAIIGRYDNRYWNQIAGTRIIYEDNNKQLFKISMDQEDYRKWQKAGLNPNDLYNYCKVELFEPSMKSLFSNGEKIEYNYHHNTIENLSYGQTMEELKKLQGVDVELLTNDKDNRMAVLKINKTTDLDEIYKKEMDITHQIMKMPINTIWFITEDTSKEKIIKIDRDRYDLLLYMNNQDQFDFQPDEWPIMANSFWEIDKTK